MFSIAFSFEIQLEYFSKEIYLGPEIVYLKKDLLELYSRLLVFKCMDLDAYPIYDLNMLIMEFKAHLSMLL